MTARIPVRALGIILSVSLGWTLIMVVAWLYGESPREVAYGFLDGTWGNGYGIGQVLFKATPILLTGLAVDVALRAGLFNIGAEGQLAMASLAVAVVGSRLPVDTHAALAVPICLTTAMAVGAIWGGIAGGLRARIGVHEVIATIMLNRVADSLVNYGLSHGLSLKGQVRTPDLIPGARLARLADLGLSWLRGSAASVALFIGVVAAFGIAFLASRTKMGIETALVGNNPVACRAEGISVPRTLFRAMLLSGALAGLAASGTVMGYKGYFEAGLGSGAGFAGVSVALLGRGSPVGMLLAALLFGTLQQGGLAVNGRIPMEIMDVVQGVFVIVLALVDERVRRSMSSSMAGRRP